MAKEIERKFLIRNDGWQAHVSKVSRFCQGYILSEDDRSVRIRIKDQCQATLTIKIGQAGLSRDEFEYDVPLADALELIGKARGAVIEKTRYNVEYGGYLWEVDVFEGDHAGLIVAEVELENDREDPPLPPWVGREVTGDKRYSNQWLAHSRPQTEKRKWPIV
ncbi:CYTH domain-containing protein [Allorhizobium sp. BGMRC 0089]|uniref:CYTH domain-containing protein n=1 Tax=Allorhizobium sonneratiae TaxID=2934936 RepID=UPI00203498C3|nr:CYTH domain-containing protein [Allorhizobium sonneratiae]MCM2290804.1 CYTH domain-containing protein [Allorhizobium sonneratiae]